MMKKILAIFSLVLGGSYCPSPANCASLKQDIYSNNYSQSSMRSFVEQKVLYRPGSPERDKKFLFSYVLDNGLDLKTTINSCCSGTTSNPSVGRKGSVGKKPFSGNKVKKKSSYRRGLSSAGRK